MIKINKTQTYAIRWLHTQNKTVAEIANELDLKEEDVNKAIEKFGVPQTESNVKTAKSSSKSKNLMINETSTKKNNHVSIMTKEASEYNDSVRQKNQTNPNTQKAIFRPKDNG
jgi:DNA-directed RNA polymerase specialized sigma subunit